MNKECQQYFPDLLGVDQEMNSLLEKVKTFVENQRTILLIYKGKQAKKPGLISRIFQKKEKT